MLFNSDNWWERGKAQIALFFKFNLHIWIFSISWKIEENFLTLYKNRASWQEEFSNDLIVKSENFCSVREIENCLRQTEKKLHRLICQCDQKRERRCSMHIVYLAFLFPRAKPQNFIGWIYANNMFRKVETRKNAMNLHNSFYPCFSNTGWMHHEKNGLNTCNETKMAFIKTGFVFIWRQRQNRRLDASLFLDDGNSVSDCFWIKLYTVFLWTKKMKNFCTLSSSSTSSLELKIASTVC